MNEAVAYYEGILAPHETRRIMLEPFHQIHHTARAMESVCRTYDPDSVERTKDLIITSMECAGRHLILCPLPSSMLRMLAPIDFTVQSLGDPITAEIVNESESPTKIRWWLLGQFLVETKRGSRRGVWG